MLDQTRCNINWEGIDFINIRALSWITEFSTLGFSKTLGDDINMMLWWFQNWRKARSPTNEANVKLPWNMVEERTTMLREIPIKVGILCKKFHQGNVPGADTEDTAWANEKWVVGVSAGSTSSAGEMGGSQKDGTTKNDPNVFKKQVFKAPGSSALYIHLTMPFLFLSIKKSCFSFNAQLKFSPPQEVQSTFNHSSSILHISLLIWLIFATISFLLCLFKFSQGWHLDGLYLIHMFVKCMDSRM